MATLKTTELLEVLGVTVGSISTPYYSSDFYERMMRPEPIPHRVYYAGGRHHHVAPDRFFFAPYESVWIVPGTENGSR